MNLNSEAWVLVTMAACMTAGCADEVPDVAAMAGNASATETKEKSTAANRVEALGQITATIDGETGTWYVTASKDGPVWRSQSDWTANKSGSNIAIVSLFGLTDASRTMGSNGTLRIGFSLAETGGGHTAGNPEINLHPQQMGRGIHSSSNDGSAQIQVKQAVLSGDMLRLTGNFSGRLPYRKFSSREADMTDVVEIENGRFDVAIPPLQK